MSSSNLENDRSVSAGKMYPIDLAPQKITIVKSVSNSDVKMTHLVPGQQKSTAGQIITHTGALGLMRSASQIISPTIGSQPQMIVSCSPILQGTQIVSQAQMIGGNQIISQAQLIGPTGIVSPATQIISQGSQLSAQLGITSSSGTPGLNNSLVNVSSSGTQVLNVGGQLVSGTSNLVVSSTVRTLPSSVRVVPPLPHHNARPALTSLPNVNMSNSIGNVSGVVVSKAITSHVPRGPAAGASLAVPRVARPLTPVSQTSLPITSLAGGAWPSAGRQLRGAVVYPARAPRAPLTSLPRPPSAPALLTATVSAPAPAHSAVPSVVTVPANSVLTSSGVITGGVRTLTPRAAPPALSSSTALASRPLPLLQRNYHPAKVVGVASVGIRTPVGNSAPSQLYYEVARPAPRAAAPFAHQLHTHQAVNVVNSVGVSIENRTPTSAPVSASQLQPRPTILRKRDVDGSPTKAAGIAPPLDYATKPDEARWEADGADDAPRDDSAGEGGSTTESAPSSPEPEHSPPPIIPTLSTQRHVDTRHDSRHNESRHIEPRHVESRNESRQSDSRHIETRHEPRHVETRHSESRHVETRHTESRHGESRHSGSRHDSRNVEPSHISPRKKPRKQLLTNEVRHCDYPREEAPATPPPAPTRPPVKRPQLSSSYVCGWRATAMHFTRPTDVRRRESRPKDILALANQRHVLTSADGWKLHHLTAQMDDLVSLEADVGSQLSSVLRSLEAAQGRAHTVLAPHAHTLLELVKGNIQRSQIVCEGIQEAREDILRVFTHRSSVGDILTRQADKRCFRKHRSQS